MTKIDLSQGMYINGILPELNLIFNYREFFIDFSLSLMFNWVNEGISNF